MTDLLNELIERKHGKFLYYLELFQIFIFCAVIYTVFFYCVVGIELRFSGIFAIITSAILYGISWILSKKFI